MMEKNSLIAPDQTAPKGWQSVVRIFLIFFGLYVVVWVIRVIMGVGPNWLMRSLGVSPDFRAYVGSTLNYGASIVSYIWLTAIALRKALHVHPWDRMYPFHKSWWKDLLFGVLLVAIILISFFLVEIRIGWLVVERWKWQTLPWDEFLRTAWVGLLVNIGVAIGEESIFRGYLLTALRTSLGKWTSIIVMMVVFGLFHLPAYSGSGGMHDWTLTLAILLATSFGGLFGLIYLRTKSLWLPTALHFAWNFIENDVLNITAVSNNPNLIGVVTRLGGPLTATGPSFSNVIVLEISMFAVICLGIWVWMHYYQKRRKET